MPQVNAVCSKSFPDGQLLSAVARGMRPSALSQPQTARKQSPSLKGAGFSVGKRVARPLEERSHRIAEPISERLIKADVIR